MTERIIVVGGVAGGASFATRYRRLNEEAEIVMYEAGKYISFANCGLPYFVGGTIKERASLLVESVEEMEEDFNIEVHTKSKVTLIDPDEQTIQVKTADGIQTDHFDKLVLSTGAHAIVPNFPGLADSKNIFSIRNVPDIDQVVKYLDDDSQQVKKATVIGGGFIGLEMAENLSKRGLDVTLIEASPQVLPSLDFEMAQALHEHLELEGVNLLLNTKVAGFSNDGHQVDLESGDSIDSDINILAIGIKPNSEFAIESGVNTDAKGFIDVDEHFQTNLKNVYAIGDVINVTNAVTGQKVSIPLAGPANRQGRVLADIFAGLNGVNAPVLGSSVAKVYQLTASSTGANERQLQQAKIPYTTFHLHPNSSAGYYPGAAQINFKIIYGKDGTILGAQAVGTKGIDKRIDIIATAIKYKAKVTDLADIEVAYAPPYASAKDPVNFAGYIAENLQDKLVKTIQWHQVDQLLADKAFFLDVRNPDELFAEPALPDAVNIPRAEIRDRLAELPKDKKIYVYCAVGLRGYNVVRILNQEGFDAYNLDGGLKTYNTAKYQVSGHANSPKTESVNDVDDTPAKPTTKIELDACGLQCTGPIVKVKDQLEKLEPGDAVTVTASDFGFYKDIQAWADSTGNTVLDNQIVGDKVVATVVKGTDAPATNAGSDVVAGIEKGTTIVVFDGDFDKAIASLIIAQGAAAMGQKVTMFFTFWGLNILRREDVKVKKNGIAKAFDVAMPRGVGKLPLSKMNALGLGRDMMKGVMRNNNVDQLEVMLHKAQHAGVKMVACTMSMGLMGIEKDELIDDIDYGGVASYLGDASQRNTNLFI